MSVLHPTRAEFGGSPFHVKGLVYARTKGYFDAHVPGGSAALLESFPTDELRDFFSQQFLAMRWYDALPIEPLVEAEAACSHLSVASYLKKRAGWQAEEDIKTVYSLLLRIASPERVAMAMPRLMSQMMDFGTATVNLIEPRHVSVMLSGMPGPLVPWYEGGMTAYSERALLLAGAKRVAFDVTTPRTTGQRAGVPLVDMAINLRWF